MILTEHSVINYLLFRNLMTGDDALSDLTTVKKSSSRNRNFVVKINDKPGYFIKQSSTFLSESTQTLKSEANCYWLANNDPLFAPLLPFLCKYFDYHPQYNILIIESVNEGRDVFDLIQQQKNIPETIAIQVANSLSGMHHINSAKISNTKAESLFTKFIPWIFKIQKDKTNNLQVTSPATKQLLDIVNQHENYIQLINENKDRWETTSLIHGDIKFPNFLIDYSNGTETIKLIDLEISDLGDPCWDVAGVLQAYLTWWIDYAKAENQLLTNLQPSIKTFWKTYAESMSDLYNDEPALLLKSICYTAIRMIQTSYETANGQQQLMNNQIKTLQMSLNILMQPKQACYDLLGIN
jgi:thiamine kinase-like enzyme